MPAPHPRRWRRGSLFGPGPRRPLDREQRARFRFILHSHRRAGRLTRAAEDVGEALVKRLGVDGQCDPAHATLAADAGCCERTVRRATASMRALGILRWTMRLVRAGWRVEQTSNAYELVPSAVLPIAALPAPRCGGQGGRQTQTIDVFSAPPVAPEVVAAAQAALARRRAAIERGLMDKVVVGVAVR